jgi:prevent-host-death family protein
MGVVLFNHRNMTMKTISALDAKNSFGVFLDTVRREPVTITKNKREVGAMFSMEDLQALAVGFLAEPIKADVDAGKMGLIDALMLQVKINNRIENGRKAIDAGQGINMDASYFESLQARALSRR